MRSPVIVALCGALAACASVAEAPTVAPTATTTVPPASSSDVDEAVTVDPGTPLTRPHHDKRGRPRPKPPTTASGPPTTTFEPTQQPPTPKGSRQVTFAFTGDTLTHSPLWEQAQRNAGGKGYDFGPMQARLAPLLNSVDVAVCHLETPIAPAGQALSTAPAYGVPPEVVTGLVTAGYDRCSTASNHTFDRGVDGIARTVDVLALNGIAQSGMARTPDEIAPKLFRADGITFSHLSYTFSYNGINPPAGQEWRSALINPDRIIGDARTARAMGAQVVIVSMHWGEEKYAAPTGEQRVLADTITKSGAVDLIVGHHAHVLQPAEQVNDRWVLFGLGNVLSNLPTSPSWPASSQDGAVAVLSVTVDRKGRVDVSRPVIHPTWVDRDAGWIVRLVQSDLADPSIPDGMRTQLDASLARTRMVLDAFVPKV